MSKALGKDTPESSLKAAIDDNALNPVPLADRRSGWYLMANTAGVGTTLALLLIGGSASYLVGTKWTLILGVTAAVFGSILGTLVGRVCQSTGMTSTATMRFHGLGLSGSSVGSLIFAIMIIGFIGIENTLLYYGTLFLLGWSPDAYNAVLIYGLLAITWIVLSTFGIKVVQKTSLALTLISGVLIVYVTFLAVSKSDMTFNQILASAPSSVEVADLAIAFSSMIAIAGALSLFGADSARYARNLRDVAIMSVGGSLIVNFFFVALGAALYQAGDSLVARYLDDAANYSLSSSLSGASTLDKVQGLAHSNTGAYFIILVGTLGFVVMYCAQVKAQVINSYTGSFALANLFEVTIRRKPNRFAMIIVVNALALLAVAVDILSAYATFLSILGILIFSLCALVVTDHSMTKIRNKTGAELVEKVNWAGIIAISTGSVTSYILTATGALPFGFLATVGLTPLVYVILRRTILTEGTGTTMVSGTSAFREADGESDIPRLGVH